MSMTHWALFYEKISLFQCPMKVHIFTDKLMSLARPDSSLVCLSSTDAVAATDLAQAASEPSPRAAGLCLRRPGREVVRHHLSQKHQVKHSHLLRRYPGNYNSFVRILSFITCFVRSLYISLQWREVSFICSQRRKQECRLLSSTLLHFC